MADELNFLYKYIKLSGIHGDFIQRFPGMRARVFFRKIPTACYYILVFLNGNRWVFVQDTHRKGDVVAANSGRFFAQLAGYVAK